MTRKIVMGGWFDLPKLGRDAFSVLMKLGVKYETGLGFKLDGDSNVEGVVNILSAALGENVELSLRCFVCGVVACEGCNYLPDCDRRKVSSSCLCAEHATVSGAYEAYSDTFRENL